MSDWEDLLPDPDSYRGSVTESVKETAKALGKLLGAVLLAALLIGFVVYEVWREFAIAHWLMGV